MKTDAFKYGSDIEIKSWLDPLEIIVFFHPKKRPHQKIMSMSKNKVACVSCSFLGNKYSAYNLLPKPTATQVLTQIRKQGSIKTKQKSVLEGNLSQLVRRMSTFELIEMKENDENLLYGLQNRWRDERW
jgi:hypothetical protein